MFYVTQKQGRFFLQYFPSRIEDYIKTSVAYEMPSLVRLGPFLYNYRGNKFAVSVPKGLATWYGKLFGECMLCPGEMRRNRTEESEVVSWLLYS